MRVAVLALVAGIALTTGACAVVPVSTASPAPTSRPMVEVRGPDGVVTLVPAPPPPPANLSRPKSTPTPALLSPEERAKLVTPPPRPSGTPTYPPIDTPVHAPGASTGVPEVDAVIAALLSGDEAQVRGVMGTRDVECAGAYTTMHPASTICEGKPEDSVVRGFARGYGEWRYFDLENEGFPVGGDWKGLYAVVRIDSADVTPEAYQWARRGDYVAILVQSNGVPGFDASIVLIEHGKWIGATFGSAAPAASPDGFAKNGRLVVPPPPGAPPYVRPTPRASKTPQRPPTFATAPAAPTPRP